MANEKNPSVDLSGLEDVFEWLKARKNLLVGAVLVVALGYTLTSFVKRQVRESELKPWREVFASAKKPWEASADELAAIRQKIEGTQAEPFVLYWEALRRFEANEIAASLERLDTLKTKFPSHALCAVKLPDPDNPAETKAAVERMVADIQRMQQWSQQYPVPQANPPPQPQYTVSFITDRGPIVLALYNDLAPRSCEAFMKTAPLLKDQFIAKAMADQWVEAGQDPKGEPVSAGEIGDDFPPLEQNPLSHFPGTVAFRQPPFSKGNHFADLRIMLKTDFNEDGRSTVFAQVAQGLDILTGLAKEEHSKENPQLLAAPLKITEVAIEKFTAPPPPPPK